VRITITEKPGDVQVWASLEGAVGDPASITESFVIGSGESRDAAVRSALEELDAASKELERDAGTRIERIQRSAAEETDRGRQARRQP
jgi:hypothetical protein